jgi:aryl-alcohol dehydrogenase-like predicted oxidoreductase
VTFVSLILLFFELQNYRKRYWTPAYFNALAAIRPVVAAHGLTMAEVALRWISHHSLLRRECGDSVLIGASSLAHIEQVRLAIFVLLSEWKKCDDYHRISSTWRRARCVSLSHNGNGTEELYLTKIIEQRTKWWRPSTRLGKA